MSRSRRHGCRQAAAATPSPFPRIAGRRRLSNAGCDGSDLDRRLDRRERGNTGIEDQNAFRAEAEQRIGDFGHGRLKGRIGQARAPGISDESGISAVSQRGPDQLIGLFGDDAREILGEELVGRHSHMQPVLLRAGADRKQRRGAALKPLRHNVQVRSATLRAFAATVCVMAQPTIMAWSVSEPVGLGGGLVPADAVDAGKRMATPDLWREERCTESKATSNTSLGSTWRRTETVNRVVPHPAIELLQLLVGEAEIGLADRHELGPAASLSRQAPKV